MSPAQSTPAQSIWTAQRWRPQQRDLDVSTDRLAQVPLRIGVRDRTQPFLLLHGGAGPASMTGFADLLAARTFARVLTPTLPGFDGTRRPDGLASLRDLAAVHVAALDELDLSDVTVVGNSLGGWLAAEIALLGSPRVSGAVIVDAVGAVVPGDPVADIRELSPDELVARSFHDPSRLPAAGGAPDPDMVRANLEALFAYGGDTMSDPTLLDRLRRLELPVQVIWGGADRIVSPAHGRAYAEAIPGATLTVLDEAGHLPQLEAPEQLLGLVNDLGGPA